MNSGNRDYVKELADWDKSQGIIKRSVNWSVIGAKLSEQEKAKLLLSIIWEIERGWCNVTPSVGKPWWYKDNFWFSAESFFNKTKDKLLGIKNPYK